MSPAAPMRIAPSRPQMVRVPRGQGAAANFLLCRAAAAAAGNLRRRTARARRHRTKPQHRGVDDSSVTGTAVTIRADRTAIDFVRVHRVRSAKNRQRCDHLQSLMWLRANRLCGPSRETCSRRRDSSIDTSVMDEAEFGQEVWNFGCPQLINSLDLCFEMP